MESPKCTILMDTIKLSLELVSLGVVTSLQLVETAWLSCDKHGVFNNINGYY